VCPYRYREDDYSGEDRTSSNIGAETQESESAFSQRDLEQIRTIAFTSGCFGLLCVYTTPLPHIHDLRFINVSLQLSLCPDIFGHELVKAGLLLGLLGGSRPEDAADFEEAPGLSAKPLGSECSIRSDIHVLIVGDPGLGSCVQQPIYTQINALIRKESDASRSSGFGSSRCLCLWQYYDNRCKLSLQ